MKILAIFVTDAEAERLLPELTKLVTRQDLIRKKISVYEDIVQATAGIIHRQRHK